ncbi:MAG: tyrosine-type recombinase/integrase [Pirellulaceae bacterium]|nr:tyrosine-type recombinase/integrase [Planctomycetales bacterium]
MGRKAGIWWRKSEKAWYVTVDGKQIRLGSDKREAEKHFHRLMLEKDDRKPVIFTDLLVCEIADKFLSWCYCHRAERTADGYKDHWERFLKWLPNGRRMTAAELKPYHVIEYMDAHDWKSCYKRNAAASVQRAFKWSVSVGLLDFHPCTRIPKPKADRRETPVTQAEYQTILRHSKSGFRDLVTMAWETGARPFELRNLQPRHVDGDRLVFPVKESKGKRRSRVIYLNETAIEIVERRRVLGVEWIFTNTRGKKWTVSACNCRFRYLRKYVGRKVALYDFRHGFTERMLDRGVDHLTVAALLGHTNGQMVSTVYSHRNQAAEHLRKIVNGTAKPTNSSVTPVEC